MHWDLVEIIRAFGYIGLFIIIFTESGLLIGLFLPGDSLLFTAGFLASQGWLELPLLISVCVTAAISGDSVGYAFGHRFGRRLLDRPDSRWFKRHHLLMTEQFYKKHGGKTVILARFLPIVRTCAPIVAGIVGMRYRQFLLFNVVGALIWGAGLPLAGYIVGRIVGSTLEGAIPDIDTIMLPLVLLIILLFMFPSALHMLVARREEIRRFLSRKRGASVVLKSDTED